MPRVQLSLLALVLALMLSLSSDAGVAARPKPPLPAKGGRRSVVWTPQRITLTPDASGAASATATFISSTALDGVTLRVSGGLGRVLEVSPATIAHVDANVAQSITLRVAPGAASHNQGGVVQLRIGSASAGRPLHVQLRIGSATGADSAAQE